MVEFVNKKRNLRQGSLLDQNKDVFGTSENNHAFNIQKNLVNVVRQFTTIALSNAKTIKVLREKEQQLARQNEILLEKNRELEQKQQQINLQKLEILEAQQIKEQFISNTSHELRTPLNIILGLSQVLLRQRHSSLSQKHQDMVQRILNNGNQLLAKIDDLLYFNKVETGYVSFKLEELNLNNLIVRVINQNIFIAEKKKLNLNFNINLDNPIIINDVVRLKQILNRLLANAIKFTETGSIEIKVWEINKDRVAIAVIDTGIGIAKSDLEKIFEQFCQVDQTTTRKYSGTGLGLAITKSLLEILQGTISVKSTIGQGSTFIIELPRVVKSELS